MDIEHLQSWIGKTEELTDEVTSTPVAALAATLDIDNPGDTLRPLWHWLYFLPIHRQSELGPDGHAKRGGFLPPVDLPRRMWAGGRLIFRAPLRLGERVQRVSTIRSIEQKSGRSGELVFVTVAHAKGLAGRAVMLKHVLRNTYIPLLTVLGLVFANLMVGTAVVEYVFSWPGIGRLAVDSALLRDQPVVVGFTVAAGLIFTIMNLLVDLGIAALDPRVRSI